MLSTSSTATGAEIPVIRGESIPVYVSISGTGAVSASYEIQFSGDGTNWSAAVKNSISGTTNASERFLVTASGMRMRAVCTAISGTGATLSINQVPAGLEWQQDYGSVPPVASSLQTALPNLFKALRLYNDASPSTLRVIGLGSSVGVGATLPDASTQAPSAKLFSSLSQRINRLGNLTLAHTNGSVNGSIITDANLTDYAAAKTTAGGTPIVCCLAYGMNDGTPAQYHGGQTYPGVYTALATLVETIKGDGGDPVLMTTPHPHSTRYPWTTVPGTITYPGSNNQIPAATYAASVISSDYAGIGVMVPASYRHLRVNQAIRQIGIDYGVPVIDVERYWFLAVAQYGEDALFDTSEYVHPNLLGHQLSYWRAIEAFCTSLERAPVSAGIGTIKTEVFAYKVNNATRTSTTASSDSQLAFYAGPNTVWDVECDLHFAAPTDSDMRVQFDIPSGAAGKLAVIGPSATATTYDGQEGIHRSASVAGGWLAMGGIGADSYGKVKLFLRVGSTGGTVTLQYGLATANGGTLTMYQDSSLRARRVA